MNKIVYTKEQIDDIIEKYTVDNLTMVEIGELYNTTSKIISRTLKENGIESKRKLTILTKDNIDDIIMEYRVNEKSLCDIAQMFNVGDRQISKILKEHNIEVKNKKQFKKIYKCDETFLDVVDSEDKAYFLGIMAADGFICSDGNSFGIALQIRDIDIIQKILTILKSDYKIRKFKNKDTGKEYCEIRIASKKLCSNMSKMSITNKKTFTFLISDIIKYFKNEELIPHFIRGYFDGDGTIAFTESTNVPIFSIVATEKNCELLKKLLQCNNKIVKDKRAFDSCYVQMQSRVDFYRIYKYLYIDCNAKIFLNRKKEKFDYIVEKIKPFLD